MDKAVILLLFCFLERAETKRGVGRQRTEKERQEERRFSTRYLDSMSRDGTRLDDSPGRFNSPIQRDDSTRHSVLSTLALG